MPKSIPQSIRLPLRPLRTDVHAVSAKQSGAIPVASALLAL